MYLLETFKELLEQSFTHVDGHASYSMKRSGDKLKIFFEWSNGKTDWLNNFNFPIKPYRRMKHLWFCHRGFLKVWKTLEPVLQSAIMDPSVKQIQIAGYSHGAAVALLCYEYCTYNRPDVYVKGVGYGGPRVFWGPISDEVKERFFNFLLIRNGRDLVTRVPPALLGYRHVSRVIKIGKFEGSIKDHYAINYWEALADFYTVLDHT